MKTHPFKQLARTIKIVLILTLSLSLFSALFGKLLEELFLGMSIERFLGLSLHGIKEGYLWQFLSYLFIQPTEDGLSFSFICNLFFDLYLFCTLSTQIIQKTSERLFLALLAFTTLASSLFGFLLMSYTNSSALLIGPTAPLYAIIMAWLMLHPNFQLFLIVPMRAKVVALLFISLNLLGKLSEGSFLLFFVYLASLLSGYLFSSIVFGLRSPFASTKKLDYYLVAYGKWFKRRFGRKRESNIIDINWR